MRRRSHRSAPLIAALLSVTLGPLACHPRSVDSDKRAATPSVVPPSTPVDSARGIVSLVGNEPVATLVLTTAGNRSEPIALTGAFTPLLRRVIGLDVVLFGHLTGARASDASPRGAALFDVASFVVRSADDVAAHDGVVEFRSPTWMLRLVDGRALPVSFMPAALRQQIGARAWIAGPLDATPLSYGLIIPAR